MEPKKEFVVGDECWIYGVEDPRINRPCHGKVYHSFFGHGELNHVIAVDVLDGGFEVRTKSCMYRTERGYHDE